MGVQKNLPSKTDCRPAREQRNKPSCRASWDGHFGTSYVSILATQAELKGVVYRRLDRPIPQNSSYKRKGVRRTKVAPLNSLGPHLSNGTAFINTGPPHQELTHSQRSYYLSNTFVHSSATAPVMLQKWDLDYSTLQTSSTPMVSVT